VIVGALALLALVAIAVFFLLRHNSKKRNAVPPTTQPEYMAPVVGGMTQTGASNGHTSYVGAPAPTGAYQQNQYAAYDANGMPVQQGQDWKPPVVAAGAVPAGQGWKQQHVEAYGQSREVQTNVTPVSGPLTPMNGAHEVPGSPVGAPVELPTHHP
jgi:hypothetical protein